MDRPVTDAALILCDGREIGRRELFAAGDALARRLADAPPGPLMPLCRRRRDLLAAVIAGQRAGREIVLPPDDAQIAIQSVLKRHGTVLVLLSDDDPDVAGVESLRISRDLFGGNTEADTAMHWREECGVTLYTSGSTGAPVGHRHDSRFFEAGAMAWRRILAVDDGPIGMVVTVPGQHMFGFESSVLLPLGSQAVTVLDERPFFAADIVKALYAVSGRRVLILTPLHLRALVETGLRPPSIDRAVVATAPLDAELAARGENLLGGPIFEVYGSTETGMLATRRTALGEDFCLREDIDLVIEPDGRATAYGAFLGDGLVLNDRLARTSTGFRLVARDQDLLKVAGKRASLAGLTAALNDLPMVRDGIVLPPAEQGDGDDHSARPVAAVVVEPGTSAEDIRRGMRQRVPSVFVPRRVAILDDLPRTAVGKVQVETVRFLIAEEDNPSAMPTVPGFTIPEDHPSLPGHFPGNPIVPGAVTLDHALATAGLGAVGTLLSVRFHDILRAGEHCIVTSRSGAADGTVSLECTVATRRILSAKIALRKGAA